MDNEFAGGVIGFMLEAAGFVSHTPMASSVIAAACASLAFSAAMLMAMLCMRTHDRALDRKYGLDRDPDEDLIMRLSYSGEGTLEIRDGGCRILRSGASVSSEISGILSITCSGGADDRIISVTYEDPDSDPRADSNTKTERIRCGEMSDEAYHRLRSCMLQQMGG